MFYGYFRRMKSIPTESRQRLRQAACVLLAIVLLNASVTFHNVWPTLGVHWPGEVSVELALLLLALAVSNAWLGRTHARVLVALSVLVVLFGLGRYTDVTVSALYGRDINLYWDAPQFASVTGMLVRVASPWAVAAVCVGAAIVLATLYLIARWSLGQIDAALRAYRPARLGFGALGLVLFGIYLAQQTRGIPHFPRISIPVSKSYTAQIARIVDAVTGLANRRLPASPPMNSNLAALAGSDVLLIFMESYGSSTYDRPEFEQALQPARGRLQAAIHDTGRGVVSTFLTSPTFGGGSVLAHLSVMSGVEVRDMDHYALLMTQTSRPTLVSLFKSAGYRTVAVMPGLRESWPEGAFYGFDKIYGTDALDYHGPGFGWWRIPDQYSLAALDAHELQPRPRKPVFAFFPTVSTHMPFEPTPPMQSDWQRILSSQPFDAGPLRRSLTQTPVWTDLGKAYVSSVEYFLDTLASYLRARPNSNFVMIILGDHQPAASVSGEGASWDVPVHVIASSAAILAALQADGFRPGLAPVRPTAGTMNELGPWSAAAFGTPALKP
jgi:hypothetical protein